MDLVICFLKLPINLQDFMSRYVSIILYDIRFSYPLDVVRRRMQLAGAVTDGYKYRYYPLAFFQFVHSILSLKAGARGFPPACIHEHEPWILS